MHPALVGAIYLVALFALAVVLLMLKDRLSMLAWRIRNPPAKIAAQRERSEQRLRSPDWVFYEQHLQRPVPAVLRETFATEDRLSGAYHFSDFYVTFAPIDGAALGESWVLPGVVPFAESDGDPIFLKPGASTPNAVFIAFHDGGGSEELAPSVEAFVAGLRVAA